MSVVEAIFISLKLCFNMLNKNESLFKFMLTVWLNLGIHV